MEKRGSLYSSETFLVFSTVELHEKVSLLSVLLMEKQLTHGVLADACIQQSLRVRLYHCFLLSLLLLLELLAFKWS